SEALAKLGADGKNRSGNCAAEDRHRQLEHGGGEAIQHPLAAAVSSALLSAPMSKRLSVTSYKRKPAGDGSCRGEIWILNLADHWPPRALSGNIQAPFTAYRPVRLAFFEKNPAKSLRIHSEARPT